MAAPGPFGSGLSNLVRPLECASIGGRSPTDRPLLKSVTVDCPLRGIAGGEAGQHYWRTTRARPKRESKTCSRYPPTSHRSEVRTREQNASAITCRSQWPYIRNPDPAHASPHHQGGRSITRTDHGDACIPPHGKQRLGRPAGLLFRLIIQG